MFEILKNESATVEEMAQGYLAIERHLKSIETEKDATHQAVIAAKIDGGTRKELEELKDTYGDLGLDIEACQSALDTLFTRMTEALPGELQERKKDLQEHINSLLGKRKNNLGELVGSLAAWLVAREQITGGLVTIHDTNWLRQTLPVDFENTRLQLGQLIQVEKSTRPAGPSINWEIEQLRRGMRNIESIIGKSGDEIVQKLLEKTRNRSETLSQILPSLLRSGSDYIP